MGGILKRMPLAAIITKIYNSNDKKFDDDMNSFKNTVDAARMLLKRSIERFRANPTKGNKIVMVALMSSAEQVMRGVEVTIHNVDDSNISAKKKIIEDVTDRWADLKQTIGEANELIENEKKDMNKVATPPEFELSKEPPEERDLVTPADLGYTDFCTRLTNMNFTYKNMRSYPKKFDVDTLKEESRVLHNQIGQVVKQLKEGGYDETDPETYSVFVNLQHEVKLIMDDVTRITPVRF